MDRRGDNVQGVPKSQTTLTPEQERRLRRLMARQSKAEDTLGSVREEIDEFLREPDVSISAAARFMGMTPQALYERARKR